MAPCINSRRLLPNDGNSDCKYELRPAAGVDVARGQEIYCTSPHCHIITNWRTQTLPGREWTLQSHVQHLHEAESSVCSLFFLCFSYPKLKYMYQLPQLLLLLLFCVFVLMPTLLKSSELEGWRRASMYQTSSPLCSQLGSRHLPVVHHSGKMFFIPFFLSNHPVSLTPACQMASSGMVKTTTLTARSLTRR